MVAAHKLCVPMFIPWIRTSVYCTELIPDYVARNQSINTTIPFFGQFTAIHVHNWIVFQQRIDGSVSFNRPWIEYKAGFGRHDGNFWLGLEKVRRMTNSAPYKLRIEFMLMNGSWYSVEYDTFRVESEASHYKIHVTGYSGDVYDVMNLITIPGGGMHNGMNFTTYDRDNDRYRDHCFSSHGGGWWYSDCYHFNLNGRYGSSFDVVGIGLCSVSRMMMKKVWDITPTKMISAS